MTSTGHGWSHLRQEARSLESQTETLFHTYSQYAWSSNISSESTEEEKRIESQLSEVLEKRNDIITQLNDLLETEAGASALRQSNLIRHRDILQDHRRELSRLKSAIIAARNRANLLSNVRSDINAYRSSNPDQAEADYMLDERRRIDNSHSMADNVLSQAYAVRENFGLQRETLSSINRRIVGVASQIPGMNSLMGRISSKKRRDAIILAVFIALCFLMLLYFR